MKNKMRKLSSVIYVVIVIVVVIVLLEGWKCNAKTMEIVEEMEDIEKERLYNAIQGFVGNWWNGSFLYPNPCGWTPIQGVSCDFMDGFWHVTDLNIGPVHENSLTCSENPKFRSQLFELKHLRSLSFYNCFSSQQLITLPNGRWESFGASLESLEFRSNPSLIGGIPFSFGDLKKLQSLVIIENGMSGNIPSSIGNLRNLKRLVLSGNNVTGRIIDSIGYLSKLLILDLSRNSLSGYIPFSIGYLKSLLKLDLSDNLLMGSIPTQMGNLKNLTLLDLRNNNFSGEFTTAFEEMTSLEELVLGNNQIAGEIVNVRWEKMQNLIILDLSNVNLSGEIPKSITKLKKLRYLGLSNNNFTGNVPSDLAYMPYVNAIYVDGNNLAGNLNFSDGFYGKLRGRFKAWNNPNLCYTGGLISSKYAPLGVNPCKSDEMSSVSGLKSEVRVDSGKLQEQSEWISDSSTSFGLLRHGINMVWVVLLVDFIIINLL